MSALGQKQTYALQQATSALLPKADMCGAVAHVGFGPKADITVMRHQLFQGFWFGRVRKEAK
jgi:hypothetical protein